MRRGAALASAALAALVAAVSPGCDEDTVTFPVAKASPSRHGALRDALSDDARGFAFERGDWLEDQGDAAGFGLAVLARRGGEAEAREAAAARARALLAGPVDPGDPALEEKVLAAFGLLEHVGAGGAGADVLDGFLDRLDAAVRLSGDDLERLSATSPVVAAWGSTVATGTVALLHAQAALVIGGPRAGERQARAVALEQGLYARAFGDLADPGTAQSARAFATAPGRAALTLLPNVVMMLVETRLFRLTKDEGYRLAARALFAGIKALRLGGGTGTRWSEPERAALLGATTRDVSTVAGQAALALALLSVFEVTGDPRYVEETDGVLDALAVTRGPWCRSQLGGTCTTACGEGDACTLGACTTERCATGLLHHVVAGALAAPGGSGPLYCSGCSFLAQLAVGTRRTLAGEPF